MPQYGTGTGQFLGGVAVAHRVLVPGVDSTGGERTEQATQGTAPTSGQGPTHGFGVPQAGEPLLVTGVVDEDRAGAVRPC